VTATQVLVCVSKEEREEGREVPSKQCRTALGILWNHEGELLVWVRGDVAALYDTTWTAALKTLEDLEGFPAVEGNGCLAAASGMSGECALCAGDYIAQDPVCC